jgi:hypothetical protein
MARKSDASNRIGFKEAAPVLGAVGALSLAGGASAATTGPVTDAQSLDTAKLHQVTISEEELTDVSLATFYVFDKENAKTPKLQGEQVAWWVWRCRCGWRCWGCRRCWGCGCRC